MSDFQKAAVWSPYEKKDPAMKRRSSGAAGGKGSVHEFEGNNEVGTDRLEIMGTAPISDLGALRNSRFIPQSWQVG